MVLVEQTAGGAVFSVGSICFTGALSHNNYRNNVATVVGNVLQNFLARPAKTPPHRSAQPQSTRR
jgi:N,N-dimethylformamidase